MSGCNTASLKIGIMAVVLVFAVLTCGRVDAQGLGSLDGSWEGELKITYDSLPSSGGSQTVWYRLAIQGSSAHIFYKSKGEVGELDDRKVEIARVGSNAVIISIASGRDDDGTWVETWVFAVTLKDRNTLIAHFTRMVNNNDLPLSVAHSKFSRAAVGELRRR